MIPPLRWIDRKLDRATKAQVRNMESLVRDGHDHERRMTVRMGLRFLVLVAAMLVVLWVDAWWTFPANVLIGYAVGTAAMTPWSKASAYRSGWLDGRLRFLQQAEHHQAQGNAPRDWVETELLHDTVHVLGLPADPPDDRS